MVSSKKISLAALAVAIGTLAVSALLIYPSVSPFFSTEVYPPGNLGKGTTFELGIPFQFNVGSGSSTPAYAVTIQVIDGQVACRVETTNGFSQACSGARVLVNDGVFKVYLFPTNGTNFRVAIAVYYNFLFITQKVQSGTISCVNGSEPYLYDCSYS